MNKQIGRAPGGRVGGLVLASLVAVFALVASPPAGGAKPTRYLDQVFDEVTVTRDLVYLPSAGLALDLYEPTGDPASARPALIWMHGVPGNKGNAQEVAVSTWFTQRGFVAASLDYEYYGGTRAEEAKAAVGWLRAHASTYRIDPDRIVLAGVSGGAITSLEAAYAEDITDDQPPADQRAAAVISIEGASLSSQIQVGEPPLFMGHGTEDVVVPYADGVATCDGATAAGVACEFHSFPTDHNGLAGYTAQLEQLAAVWLYEVLDLVNAPNPPLPEPTTTTLATSSTTSPGPPPVVESPPRAIPIDDDATYAG